MSLMVSAMSWVLALIASAGPLILAGALCLAGPAVAQDATKNARAAVARVDSLLASNDVGEPAVALEALAALETSLKEAGPGVEGGPGTVRSTMLGPPKPVQPGTAKAVQPDPDEQLRITLETEQPPPTMAGKAAEQHANMLRRIGDIKTAITQGREARAIRDMWHPLADQLRKRFGASP